MKHVSCRRKSPKVFFQMGVFSLQIFHADNKSCNLFYSLTYSTLVQLQCASKYTFKIPSVALSLTLSQINFWHQIAEKPVLQHRMFDQGTRVVVLSVLCVFYWILTLTFFSGNPNNLPACSQWMKSFTVTNIFPSKGKVYFVLSLRSVFFLLKLLQKSG